MKTYFATILFLALSSHAFAAEPEGRIAIIIDDLGYELAAGRRVVQLPGPIACAVLPETPRGKTLARQAFEAGKEVLLHLPLQAMPSSAPDDPGGLVLDMSRGQFAAAFDSSLASVPYVIGINSHRGSLLTRHPGHMSWLMEEILRRGDLFFVDSYTTHESIALDIARETGVPAVKRDVFLDPEEDEEIVEREFARLKRLALKRGLAVGIGHPYPATIALLERELPRLAEQRIELISISEMVTRKTGAVPTAVGKNRYSPGAETVLGRGTPATPNNL